VNSIQTLRLELPADYRCDDFLHYHQRDKSMLAEQVTDNRLNKGILWQGVPARIEICLLQTSARLELHLDGKCKINKDYFFHFANRILGLHQTINEFEHTYKSHSELGPLIAQKPGLRVNLSASPFEALSWAIIGQQISLNAALSIRRKFIQLAGQQHSSGLWCYPDEQFCRLLTVEQLRAIGFSNTKALTLITLSDFLARNPHALSNPNMDAATFAEISAQLLQIRGIGPWTVHYGLLRGFGWLDGSLHGDIAVRRNLQKLLGTDTTISEQAAREWLSAFSPWRALVAAHLWAMQNA